MKKSCSIPTFSELKPHLLKMAFSSTLLFTSGAWATTFNVTSAADSGPNTLRAAITAYNAAPTGSDTIAISLPLSTSIILASNLPPLNGGSGNALTIDATAAPALIISGNNSFQVFFVNSGNVSVVGNSSNPMAILNGKSTGAAGGAGVGGGGGGGGSAGGGAFFVNNGNTQVSISNCTLAGNQAMGGTGGAGGQVAPSSGGAGGGGAGSFGGGAGGAGGTLLSGGGGGGGGYPGGGAGGAGGDPSGVAGGNNTLVGGGGGGGGTGDVGPAGAGGTGVTFGDRGGQGGTTSSREDGGFGLGGGGGGGGHDGSIGTKVFAGGPLGGGGGGGGTDSTLIDGGDGGLGAGGGGGNSINSGNGGVGGFGGGGGGGGGTTGTGGSSIFSGGTGGNGGTVGGNHAAGGGGGGSAFGGAIFIHQNGTFTIGNNCIIETGSVLGGAGGAAPGGSTAGPGTAGGGLGQQIFMLQGGTLNFNSSTNMTLANPIQGDGGAAGGTGGGLIVNGPGSLTLSGANTYTSTTIINGGTFALAAGATVTAPITFNGGTLDLSANGGTVTLNNLSGSASSTILLGNTNLAVNETQDSTFAGTITGSGGATLTIQGTNTLTLSGTGNTYGGGTTIAGTSTCAIADNGSLGADGTTVTFGSMSSDDTTLQIGATSLTDALGSSITFNKNMGLVGAGHLNLQSNNLTHTRSTSGANLLEIRARNSVIPPQLVVRGPWAHTGGTRLTRNVSPNADTGFGPNLILQGNMATLPTNGDLTMDINTNFDMSDPTIPGAAQTLGNLNGSGAIQVGSNTLNLNLTANAEYDGNISDSATITNVLGGTLVIDGGVPGKTMTLTGTNTHTGGTKLKTIALQFCRDVNLGGPNVALQMGVATSDLPELDAFCSQVIMSRAANLAADKNVIGLAGNELIHNGSLATTGPGALHITGTNPVLDAVGGIYHVQAPMQHTGNTFLEGGTLLMDGPNATLPPGKDVAISTGTVLDISPAGTANQSIGALTGLGRAQIDRNELGVNPTADATFDGPIQGSGGRIRKSGTHKWSLSNTHTYDGGTFIDDGTIAMISNGLLPPAGDMNIGTNTLTGNVEITNPILDISAANLDQTVGSLSGNGSLVLGNTRRMTVAGLKDSLYEGVISGGPNSHFTKEGLRDLHLAGISTTTGTVEVNHGRLIIDATGDTHTAHTHVNPAGTLKGNGRAGPVQNTGFVIPGKSIGTLTTGDYDESGTLQIEVNPTQNSVLAVSGNMTINPGSTLLVAPDPGAYASTQTYTVVTVTGAGTGTYSTVTSTMPARFKPTAIYNSFAFADVGLGDPFIQIVLDVIPFANMIKGGNPGAVAKCFDTLANNPGSDVSTVTQVLDGLSNDLDELREAFNEMQPSQFGAFALAQENNDILVRAAITHRLDQLYPIHCEEEITAPAQQPGYYQNTTESTQPSKKPAKKYKGNVWFAPMGKYANQGNQQHNPGYHQASGGALLGTDYEIFDNGYLGTAVAYTFTDVDLKKSSGDADINSYYGTVYGNWFSKRVFVDAAFIAAYNHYHAKRHIEFIGRTARNGHNGYQLAGSLGTGLLFTPGHYQIQPYARADYVYLHQSGFKEHGAHSLNLRVEDKNSQYIRTDLGAKVAYCYKSEKLKYVPYFKASWIWEKQIDEAHLKAHFVGSDCNFTVTGLAPHRSLFAPSIGLTILAHEDALSVAFQYDAEVGHRFWENRAYLNLGFRY